MNESELQDRYYELGQRGWELQQEVDGLNRDGVDTIEEQIELDAIARELYELEAALSGEVV